VETKLRAALERAWNTGRRQWPDISVSLEQYSDRALVHAPTESALGQLHAADLYLACGCLVGNEQALSAFERDLLPKTVVAVRRLNASPDFCDEVHQLLREKLFVSEEQELPKIAEYAGRGPLAAWVRVSAVRTGLNLRASQRRRKPVTVERVADLLPVDDPSLEYLKVRYSSEFNAALHVAGAALADQDRTILRLKFIDELNIEQIGTIYNVHRATVARWIARIREELFAGTREELERRLDVTTTEFESLLELVRSRLDLSISALLRAESD